MFQKLVQNAGLSALLVTTGLLTACSNTSSSVSSYAPGSTSVGSVKLIRERSDTYASRDFGPRDALSAPDYASLYGARVDDGVSVPAFDYTRMNPKFLRQNVHYYGSEAPGTIVIDVKRRHLYLVERGNKAVRYGIAVGKEGFGWTGNARLQWKQKWPTWTPPPDMIARKPELKKYADGLAGSVANPLGARAMYLFKNGKDTMYRIHGTDKPFSIGKAASSGCFRMINQDVIDLYNRVGVKGAVFVRPQVDQRLVRLNRGR